MVATVAEFNHSATLGTSLPSILSCDTQERYRLWVRWTIANVGNAFAKATSLLGASNAMSDVPLNELNRNECRAFGIMAVSSIWCLKFNLLRHELAN